MPRTVITRVTETEFQTEDGRTVPHPVPFNKDEVPSVEEFQKWYNHWFSVFKGEGLLGSTSLSTLEGVDKVDVSFPGSPHHAAHWHRLIDPMVVLLRDRGVTVNEDTHPDTGHPQDTLVFVALWMTGHAPGKASRDGLGATGIDILKELVEPDVEG